jgi:hypothetical protein
MDRATYSPMSVFCHANQMFRLPVIIRFYIGHDAYVVFDK